MSDGKVLVKIKVNDDTQINYEGVTHTGGETFDCEQSQSERFIAYGWATPAGPRGRKPKPKASKDAEAPDFRTL